MSSLRMTSSVEVTGTIPLLRHRKSSRPKNVRFRSTFGAPSMKPAPTSPLTSPKVEVSPNAFDIVRMFQQSRSDAREGSLPAFKGHVGEKAKLDFFGNFHKISKITEANSFEKIDPSPNVAFIAETERTRIFPQPMGIVRRKGKESEVDVHFYRMGDDYATALSEGLKKVKSVERLNMRSNRLSQSGSTRIIQTVRPQVIREINLAENLMGGAPVRLLIDLLLKDSRNQIAKLNLENTALSTEVAKELLGEVAFNKHLKYLNLARNNLGDKVGEALCDMMEGNSTLKRLDLHWNALGSRGGMQLFNGLKQNRYLQMLDVSWNGLGKDIATATSIAEALDKHTYLLHLDMSYNSFTFEECQVIDGGLKNNHSLLGLHMDGNECYVDAKGFVIPLHHPKLDSGHVSHRIITSSSSTKRPKPKTGNCWLCGEWVEVSFEWKAGESGDQVEEPVYVHLECDNYHHDLLEKVGQGIFQLTRAVPPGDLKFFFSHKDETMLSKVIPEIRVVEQITVAFEKWPNFAPELKVWKVNHMVGQGEVCQVKESFPIKPRTPPLMYIPPGIGMEKVPWTIPISLFKDYQFDTDDILNNCFEFDWKTSRIATLVKDENQLAAVKESLRAIYPRFKDSYKYFSAIGTTDIFSVGMNSFTDFCNLSGMVDGNLFKLADLDLNMKAAGYSDEKSNPLNPPNSLVRYKMMEMLVRIAKDKFVRNKITNDMAEAVQKLLNENVIPYIAKYNHMVWRREKYLCEEVDLVFKAYKPVLDTVYHKFSGRYTKPGKKRFMSLEEFTDFCNAAGLVNENFAARETSTVFNIAMMTQIDEIHKRRHLEMTFVEFIEALGRGADMAGLPPKISDFAQPAAAAAAPEGESEDGAQTTRSEKVDFTKAPLWKKLENAMTYLPSLCPQYQKEPFVPPPYSSFYLYRMPGTGT